MILILIINLNFIITIYKNYFFLNNIIIKTTLKLKNSKILFINITLNIFYLNILSIILLSINSLIFIFLFPYNPYNNYNTHSNYNYSTYYTNRYYHCNLITFIIITWKTCLINTNHIFICLLNWCIYKCWFIYLTLFILYCNTS